MFALVDANAFYAACEVVFRPEWRHRPVVVLSNNDGCVVALNRVAKAAGIEKFKPFFMVQAQCRRVGAIVCSSNYELYGDLSAKMMTVIGRFAPQQYIYSIDETFLALQHCLGAAADWSAYAQNIRKAVWKECRLPVCVGLGPTLTLAKLANHAAKNLPGYAGVCVLDTVATRQKVLLASAVSDVWGIGRRLTVKLQQMGIENAAQLAAMPAKLARQQFSIELERIVLDLNGIVAKNWSAIPTVQQQIFSTRSVGERITDVISLQQALSKHAAIAAQKARGQGMMCKTLQCFVANSPHDPQFFHARRFYHFPVACNDTRVISSVVGHLAQEMFRPDIGFYKIGVGLVDLVPETPLQTSLFEPVPGDPALMQMFDGINTKYGRDTLFLAAQGISPQWGMRRQLLSPCYTTSWQDIPRIRC